MFRIKSIQYSFRKLVFSYTNSSFEGWIKQNCLWEGVLREEMVSFVIWDVCYINLSKSMQKQVPVRARVFANFYANLCSRHQKWQNCPFPTRKSPSNWQFLFYLPQKWTVCVWWDFLTFLATFWNTSEKKFMHTNISKYRYNWIYFKKGIAIFTPLLCLYAFWERLDTGNSH